jgi:hypothetical protein
MLRIEEKTWGRTRSHDLTTRQREIVGYIRQRAALGKPLNITAMRRENPTLMREVFAMKPFWGWYQAVSAAGIRYDRIRLELEDTVECLACGKRMAVLSGHIATIHGLTRGEYRNVFPGASCVSETLRAHKMSPPRGTPHWEPIWSAEYVLDRVRYFHDRGSPANAKAMKRIDPNLLAAGRKLWQTWDNVLRAADLDPEKIRLEPPGQPLPSCQKVIDLIHLRLHAGLPLNSKAVSRQDSHLMNGARSSFGSWRKALLAAGIRPSKVAIARAPRPDARQRLLKRAREVADMSDDGARVRALFSLRKVYSNLVYRSLGGWARVARLIGVSPERLLHRHAYSREEIIEALVARQQAGRKMTPAALWKEDAPLASAARRDFGSLQNALEALNWRS